MKAEHLRFRSEDGSAMTLMQIAEGAGLICNRAGANAFTVQVTSLQRARKVIKQLQELGRENGISGIFEVLAWDSFAEVLAALPAATIKAMQQHVDWTCEKLGIRVISTSIGSNGRAWIERKEIKIPKVKDVDTFCVCLHEIGHIIGGRMRPTYLMEYLTEKKALELAGLWAKGNPDHASADWLKALTKYEGRAKGYVVWNIGEGYKNGLRVDKLDPEVTAWLGVDFSRWPGNRVEVNHYSEKPFFTVKLKPARR